MNEPSPRLLAVAPFIFLILWAGGYAVAKVALDYAEPMTILVLRYTFVLLFMAVSFVIIRPPLLKRAVDWGHQAFVGFKEGVAAGTMAIIFSIQPILVAIAAPSLIGEKVNMFRWLGLLLGLVGTVGVILVRSEIEAPSILGLMFAVLALFGISIATLWEKRFGLTHHPITSNLIGYSAGLLGVLPVMLMTETMTVTWSWPFIASMFYLVVGNSVIGVGLLLAMIRAGDVSRVSSLFFMVPPLAAVIAWALLGEIMPPLGWLGLGVAAIGVYVATAKRFG